ncbi:SDR family NAD(P)-dependent oxidoreductase [Shouchella patagoniensis]|uniref:SDR family NAD(P)-dependent oxidoreductase n=1 Tax=Shouchella patagoniensis TaxID=228576 RepID=UPI0009959ABD|nr:SDR family oxidoreductase [Shouchella patagoniensis]
MKKLKNQVAIITGAARGIGAASALALAKEGSNVVLVDILPSEEMKQTILQEAPDVEVLSIVMDINDSQAIKRLMADVYQTFSRIDTIVNNAGTCARVDLENLTEDLWERDINTNLKGTFLMTQAAIYPYMKEQKRGKIINVSSISGIMGGPFASSNGKKSERSGPGYAASKGGVIAFTRWVAKEVGSLGITCNSIAPGPVETEITKGMDYPLTNQIIQRMGTPEDIAGAVVYFASPHSDYVTGEVLKVCGGSAIG